MDEDYDACDLENWFLAIQSADGQVIIPSFHRPGHPPVPGEPDDDCRPTLPSDRTTQHDDSQSRILRPRGRRPRPVADAFPDLVPDPTTGKINYDVDNDGDGVDRLGLARPRLSRRGATERGSSTSPCSPSWSSASTAGSR